MRFTWKGQPTLSIAQYNTPPVMNVAGPYPSRGMSEPTTVTKTVLTTIPRINTTTNEVIPGSAYYDPVKKSVLFAKTTCTSIGTSLPTVCLKKLPRPQKVWRKSIYDRNSQPNKCEIEDIPHVIQDCHSKRATGECTAVRRSAGNVSRQYCTTTREYLQKRCKTYDQAELKGKKLADYTFTSGSGFESVGVSGVCNKVTFKPSNKAFGVQGGVSSSSRTNRLKYQTVMGNVQLKNYATARATIDSGYVNIKGQNIPSATCVSVRQDRAYVTSCK